MRCGGPAQAVGQRCTFHPKRFEDATPLAPLSKPLPTRVAHRSGQGCFVLDNASALIDGTNERARPVFPYGAAVALFG